MLRIQLEMLGFKWRSWRITLRKWVVIDTFQCVKYPICFLLHNLIFPWARDCLYEEIIRLDWIIFCHFLQTNPNISPMESATCQHLLQTNPQHQLAQICPKGARKISFKSVYKLWYDLSYNHQITCQCLLLINIYELICYTNRGVICYHHTNWFIFLLLVVFL